MHIITLTPTAIYTLVVLASTIVSSFSWLPLLLSLPCCWNLPLNCPTIFWWSSTLSLSRPTHYLQKHLLFSACPYQSVICAVMSVSKKMSYFSLFIIHSPLSFTGPYSKLIPPGGLKMYKYLSKRYFSLLLCLPRTSED